MALIDKNDFQILRGGVPGNYEGCHDASLEVADAVTVVSGDCVAFDGTKYDLLTISDGAAGSNLHRYAGALYMVIEGNAGNDSFAGEFTERAAGLRGSFRVQTKQFTPAAMAVGALVSVVAGKLEVAALKPSVGEVISYDAVSGIVIVDMFA